MKIVYLQHPIKKPAPNGAGLKQKNTKTVPLEYDDLLFGLGSSLRSLG
jgi:hypothetical protein